jgi:hypothetical protein
MDPDGLEVDSPAVGRLDRPLNLDETSYFLGIYFLSIRVYG